MKRLLLGDLRIPLLTTTETILKHWGFRVLASSKEEQIKSVFAETTPNLLILGSGVLHQGGEGLLNAIEKPVRSGACPLIVLEDEKFPVSVPLPHELLTAPINVFALFEQVQKHLEKYPRKNLRLPLKLPGMFSRQNACYLAEVLSLSTHGLFIKAVDKMSPGDSLTVVIPLVGMKKELELEGRVLYNVNPGPENNYLQGVGIEFTNLDDESSLDLKEFIKHRFLGELGSDASQKVLR